jgi:putative autotransporter adhesin-like protein
MSTVTLRHRQAPFAGVAERAHRQWSWLATGLALAFAVPFVFTDLFTIDRDAYYAVYVVAVFGFFALWLLRTAEQPRAVLLRNWRWGVALGVVFAGVMSLVAFGASSTDHPEGLSFPAAILWRGVVYGAADGVLLSVFPILAVFAAFATRPLRERSRSAVAGIGALALAASLLFTAVYHLGYSDFRGEKLRKPLAGDLIWSVPTLVTLSPLGAPIAHVGLHVAAVVHTYDTDTFLPPHAGAAPADAGWVQGSGVAASTARPVPSFTAIDLTGSTNLVVHVGAPRSVVVRADENLLSRVTTTVEGRTLAIGTHGSFSTSAPMFVEITVPALDSATLSGSGNLAVTGVRGESFRARLEGSGVLDVAGAVDRLDAALTGTGEMRLEALAAREVTATLSGSGRLLVLATKTLDARLTGSGVILYGGDPEKVATNVTGSGVIAAE